MLAGRVGALSSPLALVSSSAFPTMGQKGQLGEPSSGSLSGCAARFTVRFWAGRKSRWQRVLSAQGQWGTVGSRGWSPVRTGPSYLDLQAAGWLPQRGHQDLHGKVMPLGSMQCSRKGP